MRDVVFASLLCVVSTACGKPSSGDAEQARGSGEARTVEPIAPEAAAAAPAVGPPPPAGVMLPTVGALRRAFAGPGAAYTWMGHFEVEPAHPDVVAFAKKHGAPFDTLRPGAIGAELYREQLRAAGRETPKGLFFTENRTYEIIVHSCDGDGFAEPKGGAACFAVSFSTYR